MASQIKKCQNGFRSHFASFLTTLFTGSIIITGIFELYNPWPAELSIDIVEKCLKKFWLPKHIKNGIKRSPEEKGSEFSDFQKNTVILKSE